MTILLDFISACLKCADLYRTANGGSFSAVIVAGIVLAALCWYGAAHYTRLWNKRFAARPVHHLFCFTAAILTFFAVLSWAALAYLPLVAETIVESWGRHLANNMPWKTAVFEKCYESVWNSGLEDRSKFQPHEVYPTSGRATMELSAKVQSACVLDDFSESHRFLSLLLTPGGIEQQLIKDQVNFFDSVKHRSFLSQIFGDTSAKNYPLVGDQRHGVRLAVHLLCDQIVPRTPRAIFWGRLCLVLMFFVGQIIPFAIIGWAALRDLKSFRTPHRPSFPKTTASRGARKFRI